jgi:sugar lactone lactonase YvrE
MEIVEFVDGVTVDTLTGSGQPGNVDGPASVARFNNPVNLVVAPGGEAYICDFDNGAIRKVSADGAQVDTVFADPRLVRPFGIAMDPKGILYVEADGNSRGEIDTTTGTIWRIDPGEGKGVILAENVGRPRGLAWRDDGVLVLVDLGMHVVRLMNPETGELTSLAGVLDDKGFADGQGDAARFHNPYGADWSPQGDLVLADFGNHSVRMVTRDGVVSTLAGTGKAGMVDGAAASAQFSGPKDVAVAPDGSVYVSDAGNYRIRVIRPDGMVATVAGSGVPGYQNGEGPEARFFGQEGIAMHLQHELLYVADGTDGEPLPYHRLRVLSLAP